MVVGIEVGIEGGMDEEEGTKLVGSSWVVGMDGGIWEDSRGIWMGGSGLFMWSRVEYSKGIEEEEVD